MEFQELFQVLVLGGAMVGAVAASGCAQANGADKTRSRPPTPGPLRLSGAGSRAGDPARRAAGEAWAFRARVEQKQSSGSTGGERGRRLRPGLPVPAMMRRAADDDAGTRSCVPASRAASAIQLRSTRTPACRPSPPGTLDARQAALYEVVAACCITGTESMATLTTLLAGETDPEAREVCTAISQDEVVHARMGWAHLSRESVRPRGRSSGRSFRQCSPAPSTRGCSIPRRRTRIRRGCSASGVFPLAKKREVFLGRSSRSSFPGSSASASTPSPGAVARPRGRAELSRASCERKSGTGGRARRNVGGSGRGSPARRRRRAPAASPRSRPGRRSTGPPAARERSPSGR